MIPLILLDYVITMYLALKEGNSIKGFLNQGAVKPWSAIWLSLGCCKHQTQFALDQRWMGGFCDANRGTL